MSEDICLLNDQETTLPQGNSNIDVPRGLHVNVCLLTSAFRE